MLSYMAIISSNSCENLTKRQSRSQTITKIKCQIIGFPMHSFCYEIQSTGGDKLTFHSHIKGKCHDSRGKVKDHIIYDLQYVSYTLVS